MANSYFRFRQFTIHQQQAAMKVTTDACLFGAWAGQDVRQTATDGQTVLDIGTGTGLLALQLLQQRPGLNVTGIEIDAATAAEAKENSARSPWSSQVNIIRADIRSVRFEQRFDIIISNPPFYEGELKSDRPKKNTAHHEAGLRWRDWMPLLPQLLSDEGVVYLLLPYKRIEEGRALLAEHSLYVHRMVLVRQTPAHQPFRVLLKVGRNTIAEIITEELVIKDHQQNYTPEFIALLRDYYLYLD